jgi:endo-1,4-beta-xylanase
MNIKKYFSCLLTFLLVSSPVVIPTGLTVQADTNSVTILNSDFENNSVQGWAVSGAASTEQKHTGSYSLKVDKIGGGYNVAKYDLTNKIAPGQTYSLDAWIYNPDIVAHEVDICANNIESANQYKWAASSNSVAPGAWVELKGTFTYGSSFTYTADKPNIYVESSDSTAFPCFVDDVVITGPGSGGSTNSQTSSGAGISYGFEDGTSQNWGARGSAVVSNVTDEHNNGTHSLKITGRKGTWEGPIVDITNKVQAGVNYHFSAWVKYNDGPATKQFNLMTDSAKKSSTDDEYDSVGSAILTKGQWTKIEGNYVVPTNLSKISLYIETPFKKDSEVTSDDTMDFYVDDVNIAQPGVIGAADFEDGTAGSFTTVAGAKLSVCSTVYHNGSNSLKVSGRTATYDGAQYSVLGKMEAAKTYTVSAWVYQSTGSDQTMSMKMYRNDASENHDSIATKIVPTNTWTELKGEYTLNSTGNLSALNIYIESAAGAFDYLVDDFSVIDNNLVPSIENNIPALFAQYSNYFEVGTCACVPDVAEGSLTAQLIAKHFNIITPGNEMKDDAIEPTENHFSFTDADKIVNFAIANKKHVRGHTLVWHAQVPDWMFLKDASGAKYDSANFVDKDTLLARMKNHIDNVMGHYKDIKAYDGTKLVGEWDVVNEAFDPGSKDSQKVRDKDYSNQVNRWYAILGADYIKDAFVYARQADPDAKLFYNDYGTEDPVKRQAMYDYVVKLKNAGLIDGVGLQSHIDMTSPSIAELEKTIKMFTDLGLEVRLTELDITIRPASVSNEVLVQQAYRYKAIFDMCKKYAHQTNGKGSVVGITIWGQTDDNTWLNSDTTPNNYPLLFDKNYKAKLAYWALVDPSKIPANINSADSSNGSVDINSTTYNNAWDLSKPYSITDVNGQNIATFKTMWDNKNLYVYGKVNDSTNSGNDSVDVFVDQNNDKSTAMAADNRVLHIDRKDASKNALLSWDGTKFTSDNSMKYVSVTETNGGYNFVGMIPLNSVTPAEGAKAGFDIKVNDGEVVTSWNDQQNLQMSNPSRYGVLTLTKAPGVSQANYGTPKMDVENLDPLWSSANSIETNVKVSDNSTNNTGKAKVRTLWDKDNLYVLAEVNDPVLSDKSPNPWEQDSVEIFVDEDNAKGISYDANDSQLRINYKNILTANPEKSSSKVSSVTRTVYDESNPKVVKGYMIEEKIHFNNTMQSGSAIGFDVQVNNDKDGSGTRGSAYTWNDASGNSYKDTSGYGVLRLSGGYVQPVSVTDTSFTDLQGNSVTKLAGGSFICGNAKVKNSSLQDKEVVLVTTLTNASGAIENISMAKKNIKAGAEETFGSGFALPANVEGYQVKVLVWDNLTDMNAISNVVELGSK